MHAKNFIIIWVESLNCILVILLFFIKDWNKSRIKNSSWRKEIKIPFFFFEIFACWCLALEFFNVIRKKFFFRFFFVFLKREGKEFPLLFSEMEVECDIVCRDMGLVGMVCCCYYATLFREYLDVEGAILTSICRTTRRKISTPSRIIQLSRFHFGTHKECANNQTPKILLRCLNNSAHTATTIHTPNE